MSLSFYVYLTWDVPRYDPAILHFMQFNETFILYRLSVSYNCENIGSEDDNDAQSEFGDSGEERLAIPPQSTRTVYVARIILCSDIFRITQ